jgi:hypothetical protein
VKEEEMIRGTMLLGTFVFSLVNAALADGRAPGFVTDPQDRLMLMIWDRPAFEPGSYQEAPWLSSRRATNGRKVDFLLDPKLEITGPLVAQHESPLAAASASGQSFVAHTK